VLYATGEQIKRSSLKYHARNIDVSYAARGLTKAKHIISDSQGEQYVI
jgi:hypothetical protein